MPFTPFDDSQTVARPPRPTRNGYDTSGWDLYRQGVEITNDRFRFLGSQPKLWSGNTDGSTDLVTYGQALGAIDENTTGLGSKFKDLPRFDPVAYIEQGDDYPRPLLFNEGPAQKEEAAIEPITIPMRLPTNEGPFYAHSVRGEMEDGSNFDSHIVRSTNRFEQFIEFHPPVNIRFFLDEGGDYFGNVMRAPYVADIERKLVPFDDTLPYTPEKKLSTTNSTIQVLVAAGSRTGDDNFLPYGKKSAPAGYSYYGRNAGQYGTDSIAFGGWACGS
jgi:hypothetical protein